MFILYIILMMWIVFPVVVAVFNVLMIGVLHITKSDYKPFHQPIKLVIVDLILVSISTIMSLSIAYVFRNYASISEELAIFIASIISCSILSIYVIKYRDNLWYNLLEMDELEIDGFSFKILKLPKVFNFIIPTVVNNASFYMVNNGIIIDQFFYEKSSEILKKYFFYLVKCVKDNVNSTRLLSYVVLSQFGVMLTALLYYWVQRNITLDTILEYSLTRLELYIILGFLTSITLTSYSFFMLRSLYKWPWFIAEQNLKNVFSELEIKQIQSELNQNEFSVNGFYTLWKRGGYCPKIT